MIKNSIKTIGIIILFSALFFSCEKNINFNLKEATPLLVVDAQIENAKYPTVVLTKSFAYFDKIDATILSNSFVHNADVIISNGSLSHQLKEYNVAVGNGYVASYYGVDTSNLSTAFVGTFNTSYSLSIKADGIIYTANTTIPLLSKYPDSIWVKKAPLNSDTNTRVLMSKIKDPAGLGNYIRYFTKKNSGNFLPGANSVFPDDVIDGTTYQLQVEQGVDRNNKISSDSNYFKKGDTITLKVCDIDKATFTFWNTWEFAQQSLGNPFSQPNKVIGNISNGALGSFCGYAAWYKTIVAQ